MYKLKRSIEALACKPKKFSLKLKVNLISITAVHDLFHMQFPSIRNFIRETEWSKCEQNE